MAIVILDLYQHFIMGTVGRCSLATNCTTSTSTSRWLADNCEGSRVFLFLRRELSSGGSSTAVVATAAASASHFDVECTAASARLTTAVASS